MFKNSGLENFSVGIQIVMSTLSTEVTLTDDIIITWDKSADDELHDSSCCDHRLCINTCCYQRRDPLSAAYMNDWDHTPASHIYIPFYVPLHVSCYTRKLLYEALIMSVWLCPYIQIKKMFISYPSPLLIDITIHVLTNLSSILTTRTVCHVIITIIRMYLFYFCTWLVITKNKLSNRILESGYAA